MLLGSDLLIFSNEKYAAVSLHLWDVSRKVTPLTWLEAWLVNFMASVPELAICYHQDDVVQGYELLKHSVLEDYTCSSVIQTQREQRKHEVSANDTIREALSLYESLGDLRRQEAAYTHFQLACHQRDCCLRFWVSDQMNNLAKVENSVVQKVKQYASLAERNWQNSMDFYGPKTHPVMYLTILIDMSALSSSLSNYLHSTSLLDSALTRLLEGRHLSEETSPSPNDQNPKRLWTS
ncbi:uncharacterized protein [Primulina huaijiensis]|uniref:uncharacterized protein isoform X2 n=1 Tax=Primulina huaijiensis TaxID=1492673 RepID=UPI003CC6DE42